MTLRAGTITSDICRYISGNQYHPNIHLLVDGTLYLSYSKNDQYYESLNLECCSRIKAFCNTKLRLGKVGAWYPKWNNIPIEPGVLVCVSTDVSSINQILKNNGGFAVTKNDGTIYYIFDDKLSNKLYLKSIDRSIQLILISVIVLIVIYNNFIFSLNDM